MFITVSIVTIFIGVFMTVVHYLRIQSEPLDETSPLSIKRMVSIAQITEWSQGLPEHAIFKNQLEALRRAKERAQSANPDAIVSTMSDEVHRVSHMCKDSDFSMSSYASLTLRGNAVLTATCCVVSCQLILLRAINSLLRDGGHLTRY